MEEQGRLVSTSDWEVVTKDAEGEAHVHKLVGHRYAIDHPVDENDIRGTFVTQAAPSIITRIDREPVTRNHELIAVIPDLQYGFRRIDENVFEPLHDPRALQVARMILADLKPDTIILQGDLLDFSELSKYEADSKHFGDTLQVSINGLHRYLASLRADNPNARMVGLAGNHEARLAKSVLRHNAQLANIKRANMPEEWHVNSVPFLLRMDELGIEWYGGYPANEYRHSNTLTFIHGQQTRSSGSTAALYSKQHPDTNVVFGHVHRQESHSRTDRNGNQYSAISFGALCRNDGAVPSYYNGIDEKGHVVKRYEDWQVGMGLLREYPDGYLEVQPISIRDGVVRLDGKEYDGKA
jgi:predicted phosphodiesterase